MKIQLPDTALIGAQLSLVPGVKLALLFGSTVSGRAKPDSDIDVAVWIEADATVSRYETIRGLLGALGRVLPASRIDLVVLNEAGPRLAVEVARHGHVVYEAERGVAQRFRRQAAATMQDTEIRSRMIRPIRLKRLKQEIPHGRPGDILNKARGLARLFAQGEGVSSHRA